jgi:YHS domain-containing protein
MDESSISHFRNGTALEKSRAHQKINKEATKMAKDPVCGMDVEEQKAAGASQHKGRSYFFCSKSCKEKFDRNPEQYAK